MPSLTSIYNIININFGCLQGRVSLAKDIFSPLPIVGNVMKFAIKISRYHSNKPHSQQDDEGSEGSMFWTYNYCSQESNLANKDGFLIGGYLAD